MASRPVYTSKAEGFRPTREIESLRPMAEPKPRAPRKAANPALRQVTNGIVCFCGERFGESQALEFMLHLRAEVGEVLEWAGSKRTVIREASRRRRADPETRERLNRQQRERMRDPERRERKYARERERTKTPEVHTKRMEGQRQRRKDPEVLARQAAQARDRRARKKAEHEAAS